MGGGTIPAVLKRIRDFHQTLPGIILCFVYVGNSQNCLLCTRAALQAILPQPSLGPTLAVPIVIPSFLIASLTSFMYRYLDVVLVDN
jgi:hypothetical protein